MEDRSDSETASQRATAELNRVVKAVSAEISARENETADAATLKSNRRFAKAKTARISEAAGIASAAARELSAANTRVLDEVAKAEAAGFTVQEDFLVSDDRAGGTGRTSEGDRHARAIQAAVAELVDLDEQMATRLLAAAKDLKELSGN
jgi:hypothetical protein